MKCPNCESLLVMTDRQGIEIDYCPNCRGVWLDKGELDKLIERSVSDPHTGTGRYPDRDDDYRSSYRKEPYQDPRGYPKKKKGGLLGDLFDFD